jgi:hypothetical protein
VLNYWENQGVAAWAMERIQREGFWKAMREAEAIKFIRLIETTQRYMYELFRKDAQDKQIPLLIKFAPQKTLPFPYLQPVQTLLDYYAGERLFATAHFEVFTINKGKPLPAELSVETKTQVKK